MRARVWAGWTALAGATGVLAFGTVCAAAAPPPRQDIRELYVDIEGGMVRALCTDGSRQVVLLHGSDSSADTWRPVLERLDGAVGACAYDRRGSGHSGPAPGPRGWFELIDELRRIHAALGFERGYVVVGHSLGGLYARVFAADRPTDVAGLVLVDPAHESLLERLRTGMPPAEWEAAMAARAQPNSDGVTELAVGERARMSMLPDIPVTVITAMNRPDENGWDPRFVNEAARQVHASILRGVRLGRHVPAERSGHDVQLDQPGLLVREILRVVRVSRR